LELTLDPVPQPYNATPQKILKAQTDYFNVLTSTMGTGEATLSVFRPGEFFLLTVIEEKSSYLNLNATSLYT